MSRVALKLVENHTPVLEENGEFWSSDKNDYHSLHFGVTYPRSFKPGLAQYFLRKYTNLGDVVCDPFCGRGTVALEAALMGRYVVASDVSLVAEAITKAKIAPAELAEIVLGLQQCDLKKPVSLNSYTDCFSQFFEIETYRELLSLREYLRGKNDPITRFITYITLGILHGHTSGYLSSYTLPQISISPSAQKELNNKRHKGAEYRAILPRILRKASSLLRDGELNSLNSLANSHIVNRADARDLFFISDGSIDAIITSPPAPGESHGSSMWLKEWFLGERESFDPQQQTESYQTINEWNLLMKGTLEEGARVLRSGGRCILEIKEPNHEAFEALVKRNFDSFFDIECKVTNKPSMSSRSQNVIRAKSAIKLVAPEQKIIVLRRR